MHKHCSQTGGAASSPFLTSPSPRRHSQPFRQRSVQVVRASQDSVLRTLSANQEVCVLTTDATSLVSEAASRHRTAPTASAALGRLLAGTLLLGCFRKGDEQTQVTFSGNGPVGIMQSISNQKGQVRGRVGNPAAHVPLRPDGKLNVGGIVGKGILSVVRSSLLMPEPYTGIVPIHTGEVAEDLARYLADSEQTNSALALGVMVNKDESVASAGGFLIEVLPNVSEETLIALENTLRRIPTVSDMLGEGCSTRDMAERLLEGIGVGEQQVELVPSYGPCGPDTLKDDMLRILAALGEDDVRDLLAKEGKLETTCEFCNETYQFSEDQVIEKIEELAKRAEN